MAIHPTSVKNTFGRHLIFWILFLPVMALIFVPLIQPAATVAPAEIRIVRNFGVDTAVLEQKTNRVFSKLFLKTRIMQETESLFSGLTGELRNDNSEFSESWIRGFWRVMYRALWRLYAFSLIFFLPLLCLSIPAAIDGLVVRARKQYRFEQNSPVSFYSSTHAIVMATGLFICLPFLPLDLTAIALVSMYVIFILAIWFTTANFQKRG